MNKKICSLCFEKLATHDGLCDECYESEVLNAYDDSWEEYIIGDDSNYTGYIHK